MDDRYDEIYLRLEGHLNDATKLVDEDHLVGIFLCGSQNYNLDTPQSDVDTKAIILPSFSDFAFAAEPRKLAQLVDKVQSNSFNGSLRSFYLEDKNNVEDPFT